MNTLREDSIEYVGMRRSLGYKLAKARLLFDFISFLEKRASGHITTALALEWAQQASSAHPTVWAERLSWVRGFARHRSATDPLTEIPSKALIPKGSKRAQPYLYTEEEVKQLLEGALRLSTASPLKRQTLYCMFGLLAVSGMRIGEVLDLKVTNVDLRAGIITVEGAKFGKSRLVPIHASTQKVLSDYLTFRNQFLKGRPAEHFFISKVGTRFEQGNLYRAFHALSREIGIRKADSHRGPRFHDFRHRFAIETMVRWYRNGEDAERRLPILSTYLGHVRVTDTYWYLTACPELMGAALKRLEERWEGKQ
jgi:integrase/recombinase XerD